MKKILFKFVRFFPVFILLIVLCLLNRSSFAYMNAGADNFISDTVSNIILSVSAVLLYFFLLQNAVRLDVNSDDKLYDGTNVYVLVLKNPGFYISAGFVVLYDLTFTSSLSNRLNDAIKIKPLAVIISLVYIVAASLFIRVKETKYHTEAKKVKVSSVILGFVIPSLAICAVTYFIPLIAVQWNVFVFLGRFVIIGLAIFLIVIYSIKFSNAVKNRKKFIENLKSICREKGYELSDIRRPLLSVFRDDGKINYTIKNKDAVTEHKLMCCLNKSCNVFFFTEGGIIKDLPIKLGRNNVLFSFRHRTVLNSPRCYVIFTSPPNNAVNGTANGKEYLDNGVAVGNLVYYTPTGYINNLERGIIK